MQYSLSIIDLLSDHLDVIPGEIVGQCFLCMKETDIGIAWRNTVSGSFSAHQYLKQGECFCPPCAAALKDKRLKRNCFVVTESELILTKRAEFKPVLTSAITNSDHWAAYLPLSYKKAGWLTNIFIVNHVDSGKFCVMMEEQLARFTIDIFDEFDSIAKALLPILKSKVRLRNLDIQSHHMESIIQEGLLPVWDRAKKFKNNSSWELISCLQ
jgi:hypothetical protein